MRLVNVLFLQFIICSNIIIAQPNECATQPTQSQLQYMSQHQKGAAQYTAFGKAVTYVPVMPHIIRRSDGTGGISATDVLKEIDSVNFFYANAGIEFIICGNIHYINNDLYYDFYSSTELNLGTTYDMPNVINIYFANNVYSGSYPVCGYTHFPPGDDRVMISNTCGTNGSTLAHELGHYFSLFHTHGNGVAELVNGSNCSTAGDEICDTPADPGLSSYVVNTSCVYTGTQVDALGMAYAPQTHNVMSYSRKECRDLFTTQQYQRIAYSLTNDRAHLSCTTAAVAENDNNAYLKQYPNPFSDELIVEYALTKNDNVKIELTNMLGENVIIISEEQSAGQHKQNINTGNIASGIYLLKATINGQSTTYKMVKSR